jgi:alkylhydroperoxidase family enzyme
MSALLAAALAALVPQPDPPARLPAATHDEAWRLLPRENPPLPVWARTLVGPLPRTTAAMLDLDHTQRAKNPLGPILAEKLRWAAADAMGCEYGRRYAEADLRRAGLTDADLKALADPAGLPESDRLALAFARKLTKAAYTLTDGEVARLVERFGPETVVGMVHTVAYANFHNRVCLALGAAVEPGGPLPPVEVAWDRDRLAKLPAPPRRPWDAVRKAEVSAGSIPRPDWEPIDFAELEATLDRQKARKPRLPVPDLPESDGRSARVVWSRVSLGYQRGLTQAWFATMRTFPQEANQDPVFENSVFWVVTRTNDCFY